MFLSLLLAHLRLAAAYSSRPVPVQQFQWARDYPEQKWALMCPHGTLECA